MSHNLLELTVGDSSPIVLELFDDRDEEIVFAGGERATFTVTESSSATALLDLDTGTELTVATGTNELTVQLSQAQADALVMGAYIGQVAIEFDTDQWRKSKRFDAVVIATIAPNLA